MFSLAFDWGGPLQVQKATSSIYSSFVFFWRSYVIADACVSISYVKNIEYINRTLSKKSLKHCIRCGLSHSALWVITFHQVSLLPVNILNYWVPCLNCLREYVNVNSVLKVILFVCSANICYGRDHNKIFAIFAGKGTKQCLWRALWYCTGASTQHLVTKKVYKILSRDFICSQKHHSMWKNHLGLTQ